MQARFGVTWIEIYIWQEKQSRIYTVDSKIISIFIQNSLQTYVGKIGNIKVLAIDLGI